MNHRRLCILFLLTVTALRLFAAAVVELSPQETYQVLCAQHLEHVYFGAGPGTAVILRAGTTLLGNGELGVRCLFIIAALGSGLLLFSLAQRVFDARTAFWSVLALTALTFTQAFRIESDSVVLLLCLASAWALWRAVERFPAYSFLWPVAGLFVALGTYISYPVVLMIPAFAIFLGCSRNLRREFKRPGFWSFALTATLCLIPLFRWTSDHDGITVAHLLHGGVLSSSFQWGAGLFWRGEDGTLYLPGVLPCLAALGLLALALPDARKGIKTRYLLCMGLALPGLQLLVAPRTDNPLLGLVLLLPVWFAMAGSKRWLQIPSAVALAGIVLISLAPQIGIQIPFLPVREDGRGWRDAAPAVAELRKDFEEKSGKTTFLIAENDLMASALAYYLKDAPPAMPGHPPVYIPESQNVQNEFSLWPRYDAFVNKPEANASSDTYFTEQKGVNLFLDRTALFITAAEELPQSISNAFERCELLSEIQVRGLPGDPREILVLRVYACYSYQTLPL